MGANREKRDYAVLVVRRSVSFSCAMDNRAVWRVFVREWGECEGEREYERESESVDWQYSEAIVVSRSNCIDDRPAQQWPQGIP